MEKFYKDTRDIEEVGKQYVGKTMGEISDAERKHFECMQPEIDTKHDSFISSGRSRMLTVKKLIEWLQTQDPDACVLAYDQNSDAYIEQLPALPSYDICNVAQCKKDMRGSLEQWYRGCEDADKRIDRDLRTVFRYAEDNDIVLRFN